MHARTPQTIAAHLTTNLTPAVTTAETLLSDANPRLHHRLTGCAVTLDGINLQAIAASLAEQRHQASQGRPRGESSGRSSGISNTTADTANEMHRLREIGLDLATALDRLHPDPRWPAIETGMRARQSCATEHVAACAGEAYGTLNRDRCLDDLIDAVDGLCVAVLDVQRKARTAMRARAWSSRDLQAADIDPPDVILEAAKCTSWPLGRDKDGEQRRCGNYRSDHRDANGTAHHCDTCDDCYKLICPKCWTRVRQTPGSKECAACEIRDRRQRAA